MEYLLSISIGYIFGSFPTAFLLVKKFKGINITEDGSGNVGTLNAFRTSKSKIIAISVLLIDALKGALSTFIPLLLFPETFIFPALAMLFAVFAHCFNPWLNFKGGRGLAVAAGAHAPAARCSTESGLPLESRRPPAWPSSTTRCAVSARRGRSPPRRKPGPV